MHEENGRERFLVNSILSITSAFNIPIYSPPIANAMSTDLRSKDFIENKHADGTFEKNDAPNESAGDYTRRRRFLDGNEIC